MASTPKWSATDTRRMVVFGMAIVTGLASGSNYVYSGYAPQLASTLHISSTQVNLVGTAGNLGMYLSGPLWGKMVDSRGQRIPLLIGGTLNLLGYSLVRCFYLGLISVRPDPAANVSSFRIFLLALAMGMTGVGGSAGLSSSVNAAAKSFTDLTRASATGTVLAGFGLSAFVFSMLGQTIYKGEAGGLLLLLALGTGIPLLVGSFIIRSVPPKRVAEGYEPIAALPIEEGGPEAARTTSLELVRSRSLSQERGRAHHAHAHFPSDLEASEAVTKPFAPRSESLASLPPTAISMTPLHLLSSIDFYILFTVLALLCGTGLMYINNVGTVALALAREGQVVYDPIVVSRWQASQVAIISVWNCSGRILGGVVSDLLKAKLHIRRIWFLPVVALMFVASQLAGLETHQVKHLWLVSTLLGLSYGSLFNVLPMLVLEWFGMTHFSQNYGWTCVAPVLGGNLFNLLFGRVYDSNTVGRIGNPGSTGEIVKTIKDILKRGGGISIPGDGSHDCLIGENCYATAFKVSSFACFVAFLLALVAGIRRERMSKDRQSKIQLDEEA